MRKKNKAEGEESPEGEESYEGMEEGDIEGEEIKEAPKTPKKVKRRYATFVQAPRVGLLDTESEEVIAEGEYAVLEVLANILERLERMEATIGSLVE